MIEPRGRYAPSPSGEIHLGIRIALVRLGLQLCHILRRGDDSSEESPDSSGEEACEQGERTCSRAVIHNGEKFHTNDTQRKSSVIGSLSLSIGMA